MKKGTLFLFILFVFSSALISGCCNCGKSINEERILNGYISVVGNEPFTRLALNMDDNKVFILECSDELKKELWGKQGSYYSIMYKESKVESGMPILIVEKAVPINKKSN
ncbi:MAG: hypothetical protein HYS25_14975 [Ignavibacteriales bacterium]|nr:hypothetical protein [Ignavibacteriales bacterium]